MGPVFAFAAGLAAAVNSADATDGNARASAGTDSGPAPQTTSKLGDIIVTANRRPELLQRSSLPIEVISAGELARAGVTRVADLQELVPSLTSASSGQNLSTYMRGVGSLAIDANGDSSIAYNINGVVIARTSGVGPIFFDVDRVEIIKGPQGTLYGRNASGGVINLVPRRPSPIPSAEISVETGSYGSLRLFGAAGGPIGPTLSVRAAIQFARHDGFLTDGYDDQNDLSARLSALWTPATNLSVLFVGEYVRAKGQGSGAVFRSSRQPEPSNPWTGPTESPPPQASILGPDDILTNGFVNTRIYAVSAELNWNLGPATVTFIPAYRNTRPDTLTYQAGFYFNTRETAEQQSYELRIHNESPELKWVAGAYYFDEGQTQNYEAKARPIQLSHVMTQLVTRSYALFGDATYSLTPDWRLFGGVRYSHDRKSQDGLSILTLPVAATINNFGRRNDSNVSFRAGTEYDVGARGMVFGTVATGYKAGGFFPSVPYPGNSYKPETITAYTLGARSRLFGDRVQLNLETFYWRYRNKQERFLGVLASGGVNLLTTNAGAATLYGSNLNLTARIARGTFTAGVEYLHTRYSSFSYDVANAGPFALLGYSTLATGCALGAIHVITRTLTTQRVDCSGKPLPHAPQWSGSASYGRDFTLENGDRVTPRLDVRFASRMFLSPDFIRSGSDDGYVTLDASLSYAHRGVTLTGWVRNLTNQAIYSGGFRYPFSFHEPFGDPTVLYADIRPPRRFGVTLSATTDWLGRR